VIKEGGGYISIARRWFVFTSMLHQPPEQRIPKHSRRQARTMAAWLYATRPASDKRPNGSETSKHRPELSRRSGRVGIRCSHLSADRNAVLCVELELLLADLEEAHLGGGRTQGHGGGEGGLCRRCASQQSTGHAEDVGGASVGAENSFSSEALLEAQSMWGESGRQRRYMPADSSPARACPRRAWRLRCEHSQRTVESYSTRYTRESRKTLPYPSYTVIDQPFFFKWLCCAPCSLLRRGMGLAATSCGMIYGSLIIMGSNTLRRLPYFYRAPPTRTRRPSLAALLPLPAPPSAAAPRSRRG